jgi:hypothetical protein
MALKPFNSMKNLVHNAGYFNAEKLEEWIVKSLADEGERIIKKAYDEKGFTNRTGNLHDSYVSAVFYKGRLQGENSKFGNTIRFVGDEMSSTSRKYPNSEVGGETEATKGREEAKKFLQRMQFGHQPKGITLVVAAAMFYSNIVEELGYRVLSSVSADLEKLKSGGYNIRQYQTHIKPEYITTHTIYREGGKGSMKIF